MNQIQEQSVNFDYDAVARDLGESSPEAIAQATGSNHREAEFVRRVFEWVTDVDITRPNAQELIGRRFLALAWVFDPEIFGGNISASGLAEQLGMNRKADFWTLTGEVTRHFGITNKNQSHAWNRAKGDPKARIPYKTQDK